SNVFCHKSHLERETPPEDVDFQDPAVMQGIFDAWTADYAADEEMHDEQAYENISEENRVSTRGIEVGHIFYFGTKYSEAMGARVMGSDGVEKPVHMGSYGIGPSRLVGGIIESSHDDDGIIWPQGIAPFDIGLINMKPGDDATDPACEQLYNTLIKVGKDVLYDDTDTRAGAKFATMDLIGLPQQIIVGPRGLKDGVVELKNRATGERETLTIEAVLNKLTA
ncbi:MAG: His/Gly/Thr/Pro-type tRNA ligase C-terminal domain-containing protein, partial [Hyphomicrobiales bacterium]